MISGAKSPDGALYIDTGVPEPDSYIVGGVLVSSPGDLHTDTVVVGTFNNGNMVANDGKLTIAPGGVIAGYEGGLSRTATGALVTQLNATPAESDPFVGGIRVGAAGVYVIDTVPPIPNGFDSGFDSGFGA